MVVVVEEEVVEEMVQDVGMMEAVEEEGMAPVTETTIHMPAVAAEGTAGRRVRPRARRRRRSFWRPWRRLERWW